MSHTTKRLSAALLLTALCALQAVAQQQTWQRFDSPEGRFHILMLGKPQVEVKDVDSPVGKLTLYAYSASNDTGYFLVSYGDYPVEPKDAAQLESVLDGVTTGVLKGLGAEILGEQRKIALKGFPGREFKAQKAVNGAEVIFSWKIYLVGRRLYQLAVVTQKSQDDAPEVVKFLTSFEIDK